MLVVSRTLLSAAALALIVASACGDEDTSAPGSANAGAAPTGGAPAAGGTSSNAGAPDGGLRSQSGAGAAPALGGSGGTDEAGHAGTTPRGGAGGVAGAVASDGGRDGSTSGAGGDWLSGRGGQRTSGGHAGGEHDFNLGGMDGIGGTLCWWPGIQEEDVGELIQAYDLPEDVEACAQEQCDSTECEHRSGWQWCADCTPGHDECRCACYQLYSECGDCDALGMCLGYCLVMHC